MAAREFCTLFDANYVVKALALHDSLARHLDDFHLTCFCFDEEAQHLIDALALPTVTTVSLAELEAHDPEFASTKDDRSRAEYCWTATPALPLYVLDTRPEVEEVTYLDADLLFFADPQPLFDEMGDASVLITPHRYAPEYAEQIVHGVYNVQFLTFRRDERALTALRWWHDRCVEWCYYRLEDGKLGDQKYLDDWPERFAGIHELAHKGGGLAPWNATQYDVRSEDGRVMVDDDPLVFFHYHRVALRERGPHAWRPPGYEVPSSVRRLVYGPYLEALDAALARLRTIDPAFSGGLEPVPPLRVRADATRARARAAVGRRLPRGVRAVLDGRAGR